MALKVCDKCGLARNIDTEFYPALNAKGKIPHGGGERMDTCIECVDKAEIDFLKKCLRESKTWIEHVGRGRL